MLLPYNTTCSDKRERVNQTDVFKIDNGCTQHFSSVKKVTTTSRPLDLIRFAQTLYFMYVTQCSCHKGYHNTIFLSQTHFLNIVLFNGAKPFYLEIIFLDIIMIFTLCYNGPHVCYSLIIGYLLVTINVAVQLAINIPIQNYL